MDKFGGGKRAGSGRKGFEREQMTKKILDSADKIIYETLNYMGRYKNVGEAIVVELASKIYIKAMPQKVEGETMHQVINIIRTDNPLNGHQTEDLPGRISLHRSTVSGNGVGLGDGEEPMSDPSDS